MIGLRCGGNAPVTDESPAVLVPAASRFRSTPPQNIVRRLAQLSDAMRRLASGSRDIHIQDTRGDEIAEMAHAIKVFRENALALDQLVVEREEAAVRLENIVEQRTSELRRRGEELRVTFDNMVQGVLMFDGKTKIAAWNRQLLDLLKIPESFLASGPNYADFIRYLAQRGEYGAVDPEAEVRRFTATMGERRTFERTRPDGTALEIRHSPTPEGGIVVIYSDITERRHYEETLTAARDQAEAMSRTKSSFLANMSHELRTPLNAIIGLTDMMVSNADRFGTEKAAEPLRRVHRAGKHLLDIINQVLDLSKIEAGKLDINPDYVNVPAVVEEVVGTGRSLADQNKNRLNVECPPDIGAIVVDAMRLKQVLLNLLSNACKFTKGGDVSLRVTTALIDGRKWVNFAVADFGHRHDAGTDEQIVRRFCASRANDGAPIRRNRTWFSDHTQALHHDGRRRHGHQRKRKRFDFHGPLTGGLGRRYGRTGTGGVLIGAAGSGRRLCACYR